MLGFCLHSLWREYGWRFLWHVALPHPIRTARALIWIGGRDFSGDCVEVEEGAVHRMERGVPSIVGVGFCLKPLEPPCPSGRFNHDCQALDTLAAGEQGEIPECCRGCAIRQIGMEALRAGTAFYIMTSARDILFDLFLPGLKEGRFERGAFVLCRYSFGPFALGLRAAGMSGRLLPLERGDCRDYATWLRADRGIKEERTSASGATRKTMREILGNGEEEAASGRRFRRRGNVYRAERSG